MVYAFSPAKQSNKNTSMRSTVYNEHEWFWGYVLTFASFCRYWNGLQVQVQTFVLSPLLQLLCNIDFC
jgi:hypothetical protein